MSLKCVCLSNISLFGTPKRQTEPEFLEQRFWQIFLYSKRTTRSFTGHLKASVRTLFHPNAVEIRYTIISRGFSDWFLTWSVRTAVGPSPLLLSVHSDARANKRTSIKGQSTQEIVFL